MEMIIKEMLEQKRWAVVGATPTEHKFGYKIFKKLQTFGYDVVPVNPMYSEIDGVKCYPSLKAIEGTIDCVNVVVAPERAGLALEEANDLGIKRIWFQPGAFTPEIIDRSETLGLKTVYYNCVLVELDKK